MPVHPTAGEDGVDGQGGVEKMDKATAFSRQSSGVTEEVKNIMAFNIIDFYCVVFVLSVPKLRTKMDAGVPGKQTQTGH